jgi:hypothetical protein
MGEGRSHQEDAEISCCPGVGTAKADTFTLFQSNTKSGYWQVSSKPESERNRNVCPAQHEANRSTPGGPRLSVVPSSPTKINSDFRLMPHNVVMSSMPSGPR